MTSSNKVLVLARSYVGNWDRFVPWDVVSGVLRGHVAFAWVAKSEAETSVRWIQPIPSAVIQDDANRYLMLRRIRKTRSDLRAKFTLLFGGHIDQSARVVPLVELFERTLRRELQEELGLARTSSPAPVGAIVDSSSILSSRHVAFVFQMKTKRRPLTIARDEFAARAKYSGRFLRPSALAKFHSMLDPWSSLLYEDFILPEVASKLPKQIGLER